MPHRLPRWNSRQTWVKRPTSSWQRRSARRPVRLLAYRHRAPAARCPRARPSPAQGASSYLPTGVVTIATEKASDSQKRQGYATTGVVTFPVPQPASTLALPPQIQIQQAVQKVGGSALKSAEVVIDSPRSL